MSVTILQIDDDLELPEGFAARLTVGGYSLFQTEDPDEARRRVAAGEPDLVLVEPLLATCDGMALLEELAAAPGVAVVVYTRGERSAELWGEALELGVADFVNKPATAAQLLESVEGALRSDESGTTDAESDDDDATQQFPPPAETSPSKLPPSGRLAERGFASLLHDLRGRAWSGVVIVNRPDDRIGIHLRNGNPVAVSARGEKEPLEAFLLRSGRIKEAQYDKLQEQLSVGMGSTAEILTGMDVLSEAVLEDAVRAHSEEPLLQVFGWTDADWHLLPGKRLKAGALEITRSGASLLFEGALRESPIEEVRAELDRLASFYLSEGEHASDLGPEVGLTRTMAAAVEEMQGERAVGEVVASGALDERVLYALLRTEILEVDEEPVLMLLDAVEEVPAPAPEPPAAMDASDEQEPADVGQEPADVGQEPADAEPSRAEELEKLLRELEKRDAYGVLEVAEETDEGIRSAYEARLDELERAPAPDEPKARKRMQQIRSLLEKAYEHVRDADARRGYVSIRKQDEERRAAQQAAERALEAEGWFRKGEKLLKAKQYSEAAEAFGMASHLDPDEGEYLAHLGWALFMTNPKEEMVRREANEHLAKGIKLTPERPLPYVYLGRMFKATDAEDRARKMFQKAIALDPECHPAHQELRLLNMREEKGKGGLLGRFRKKR